MGCGCKNNKTAAQSQSSSSSANKAVRTQVQNESVKSVIKKTIEKYYNKK